MTKPNPNNILERAVRRLSYQDLMETMRAAGHAERGVRDRLFFAHQVELLERFLDELVTDTAIPFVPMDKIDRGVAYKFTVLAENHFRLVPEFLKLIEILPPQNRYSEHLEAFIACCREMGLNGQAFEWKDLYEAPRLTYRQFNGASAAELFNLLVAKLRTTCLSERTKEKAQRRRSEANDYATEYGKYADAIRSMTTRLVVLRIDLEYKKEHKGQTSVLDAFADLGRFFNNQRNNSLFKGKLGFIVKLEYGIQKGLHFHLILFFDGRIKDGRRDVYLAQKIGEYWVEVITKGRGNYWNINAHKYEFKRKGILGIGLIHKYEDLLFNNLKHRVIGYLCKSTQFVQSKLPDEFVSRGRSTIRRIRRGKFPRVTKREPGRPRNATSDASLKGSQTGDFPGRQNHTGAGHSASLFLP